MADWNWGNGSDEEKPDSALVIASATPVPSPTSASEQDGGTGVLIPGKGCIVGGQGGVFTTSCQVPGCTAKLIRHPSKCFVCHSTYFLYSLFSVLCLCELV